MSKSKVSAFSSTRWASRTDGRVEIVVLGDGTGVANLVDRVPTLACKGEVHRDVPTAVTASSSTSRATYAFGRARRVVLV